MSRLLTQSLVAALSATLLGGCVYYNGVYNARAATARADDLARSGFTDSARVFWQRGAEAAEAVLRKTPDSPWHAEMLLHAGRSAAMLADCGQADQRLTAFFASPQTSASDRVLASLALSICEMRAGDYDAVEARLAPFATSAVVAGNPALAVDLVRARAQAALAAGALGRADTLLSALPDGDAPWERLSVAASRRDWPNVEFWLLDRAVAGDARPEVDPILRNAVSAGQTALMIRVVEAFDDGSTPRRDRTRLQLLAGELLAHARDTAGARAYFLRVAQRTSLDSVARIDAAANLALLDLAGIDSIATLRLWLTHAFSDASTGAAFMPPTPSVGGTSRSARLARAQAVSTLFFMLHDATDASGAAMFLAGEVARDSLRHESLAVEAWRALVNRWPDAPLAARALVMAARMQPDSAAVWHREVATRYTTSSMAAWLRGESIMDAADHRAADALLAGRWALAANALPDTLRARRAAWPLARPTVDR